MNGRYSILVLGGYGNFGKRISTSLARDPRIAVQIAGRSRDKAEALAASICDKYPGAEVRGVVLDITDTQLAARMRDSGARLVVHTSGPFQGQDYGVAEACIEAGVDYIDLADGRGFVAGIDRLAEAARARGVVIVAGASSVPGLSSAVIEKFLPDFGALRSIRHSIAPGNRAERGLATVKAILSYTGRPFLRWQGGQWVNVYGWQDLHIHRYPDPVGRRWLASCEVPDLELFPRRYPGVQDVVFHAGLELGILHLGLYSLSWLSRARIVDNWAPYTQPITAMSRWFESLGTDIGAMTMRLAGVDKQGGPLVVTWSLIAGRGDGPQIPSVPATVLAKKFAAGQRPQPSAMPCLGLFTLDEFLQEVADWDIHDQVQVSHAAKGPAA